MRKNNRVYALVGIGCKMAMWNADMNMGPKSTADDIFFGSDKALKYAIKNLWKMQGEKILYRKHRNSNYDLMNLIEVYKDEFGTDLPDKKDKDANKKVLGNILKCIDVRNFGATFAAGNTNIGLTGVVQVGQGMNIWENSNRLVIDILSPFVNSKKEGSMTSLGTKNVVDEAFYLYPISINPANTQDLVGIIEGYEGYTEEDFRMLVKALLTSATALDTNAKVGCENQFALIINCKENNDLYLANLNTYVTLNEDKHINIKKLQEYLAPYMNDIESIDVYYNNIEFTLDMNPDDKYRIMNMKGNEI